MNGLGEITEKREGYRFKLDASKEEQKALDHCSETHDRAPKYRLYRKGKNRCPICGIKLKVAL